MKHSIIKTLLLCLALYFTACRTYTKQNVLETSETSKHYSTYDTSNLNGTTLPVLMPYNRVIDPAGKVVSYGNPDLENHSLDIQAIPSTNFLAIEDRYGVAILNSKTNKIVSRWAYQDHPEYKNFMSTYSGIQVLKTNDTTEIFWSADDKKNKIAKVFKAIWDTEKLKIETTFDFKPIDDAPLALPNDLAIHTENGKQFLYVVLNGNNTLEKIDLETKKTVWSVYTGVAPYGITINNDKAFVTNWAGDIPTADSKKETAGVPYGSAFIDPQTGSTPFGTVSVISINNGQLIKSIPVGSHPNDIIQSNNKQHIYVSNGNTDNVYVINPKTLETEDIISVKIDTGEEGFLGNSPNALAISPDDAYLYVANGMDNALAVVKLRNQTTESFIEGFIPTEAYPGGLTIYDNTLFVTNLEGEGARVNSLDMSNPMNITKSVKEGAFNSHHQKATVSIIPIPDSKKLASYTERVKAQMLNFRIELAKLSPRKNQPARPMPERIGEPSLFKHVIYIIKENRTYDQILGDMQEGNGSSDLCVFGDSITPNQHKLAKDFLLMDNYYASGKCSAEGHQWTDAAMVSDYVEKNVRAWFRSYPHVQNDALVYNEKGFIWNNAADHGKTVRIYGEACEPNIDPNLSWTDIYENYKEGKPLEFHNTTTISRVEPFLSQNYPGSDYLKVPDQIRASAFIKELEDYENMPGDQFPELSVMALSVDHTSGTRPGMPTPRAMVADNDLALGRIIEAVSKSKFWKNTVIFVTEDDSQAGWDHVSAYRTTGFIVSPYSRLKKTIKTNYNQTSVVRSIEQILGIPPMNLMDATALPMFECFENTPNMEPFNFTENKIPLNEMNPDLSKLKGKALSYAKESMRPEYDHIDSGIDDVLNRIIWFSVKGKKKYPAALAGHDTDDDDD
ncbi:bifunctional YncE family protein/alkaline phosphatase family protein [Yeosuana marina]|uniref:bifunctional YncE family protein/alkaline phosphatase family protein n=1 Tax=Yeosuana marina TaxID=1565536 RepID=UPI0030C7FEA1